MNLGIFNRKVEAYFFSEEMRYDPFILYLPFPSAKTVFFLYQIFLQDFAIPPPSKNVVHVSAFWISYVNYFLLPGKIPAEISRRSLLFHN